MQAQSEKPIRVVVPLSARSKVDAVARAISNQMAKVMGHSIVIENLPGAGGMTGTGQTAPEAMLQRVRGAARSVEALNAAAVPMNKAAFAWGWQAALDLAEVPQAAGLAKPAAVVVTPQRTLGLESETATRAAA